MAEIVYHKRRPRRAQFTDKMIAELPTRRVTYFRAHPGEEKFGVRVRPSGGRSFTIVTRDNRGRQRWIAIGRTTEIGVEEARVIARDVIVRVKAGLEPFEPPPAPVVKPESFEAVAREWLKRYVAKKELRTAREIKRIVEKYLVPAWGILDFVSIKRSHLTKLLNEIEDNNGAHMADSAATVLRSIGTWYREVADDYVSPFSGVKKRVPEHKRSRDRTLTDVELRALWQAAEAKEAGAFGALVRLLVLTAQRKSKVVDLRRSDISPDGIWTIRKEPREKENAGKLLLPKMALDIIKAQQRFVGDDHVFASHRGFNFDRMKKVFDARCGVENYRLHDLRRSAKTLMARAKVDRSISERVLGHLIGNKVERAYDQYDYASEKNRALAKLAAMIEGIVHPTAPAPAPKRKPKPKPKPKRQRQPKADNVVQLRAAS